MTPDAPDNEELFTRLVAAYGDALAAGRDPDPDGDPNVPDSLRPRLRRLLDCLRLVTAARPGGDASPAASTGAGQSLLPATAADGTTPLPADLGAGGAAAGQRFGRFEILGALGSGGFGNVWLAFDPAPARQVALKVPQAKALESPELCERFLREGRAAAGLDHPNVCPVYEVGEVGGVPYIVSAYCPGGTLAAWLRQQAGPVPPETAARLVLRLAEAVQYVNERKTWHRDIKPSNVLLGPPATADGGLPFTPRLTDFGLALLAERLEVTRSGLAGTPAYMAPEQAGGRVREIGPHTDVYGLGALLYEVLTKRPPFEGGAAEATPQQVLEILRKVREEDPVPLRRLRQDVPKDLETTCAKCLEKAPKDRYASAGQLADDLRRFLAGEPIQGRPPSALGRLRRAVRKRPLRSAAAALLLLALVGGLGAGYYFDPERPRREVAAALRAGRPAVFRGDERLPGPFRQVVGDSGPLKPNRGEKCFSAETLHTSLWELTEAPACDHYRLSAEARHDTSGSASRVGLYFGYHELAAAEGGRLVSFFTLTFADCGTSARLEKEAGEPVSRLLFQARFVTEPGSERNWVGPLTPGVPFKPAKPYFPTGRPSPWRKLAAEVTPAGVRTFWEDEDGVLRFKEEASADRLQWQLRAMQRVNPVLAGGPADYRPAGGIGLYVSGGEVSFRNVEVRPLAPGR